MKKIIVTDLSELYSQKERIMQQDKWYYIPKADEIIQDFEESQNACDSVYGPCEKFGIAASNVWWLAKELLEEREQIQIKQNTNTGR